MQHQRTDAVFRERCRDREVITAGVVPATLEGDADGDVEPTAQFPEEEPRGAQIRGDLREGLQISEHLHEWRPPTLRKSSSYRRARRPCDMAAVGRRWVRGRRSAGMPTS